VGALVAPLLMVAVVRVVPLLMAAVALVVRPPMAVVVPGNLLERRDP